MSIKERFKLFVPKIKYGTKIIFKMLVYLHLAFFMWIGAWAFYYINHNPTYTAIQLYRTNYKFSEVQEHTTIKLRHVPEQFKESIVHLEDPKFWKHWGIDLGAIRRAVKLNKKMGYKAYGGSTITQQLSRTLFLTPHKNYFRKYVEVWIAFELELILGKERILELYLNHAEWGKDIYGVADGSIHYYGKPLQELSTDEQLRLITILASPLKYNPTTFVKNKMLNVRYNFLNRYK